MVKLNISMLTFQMNTATPSSQKVTSANPGLIPSARACARSSARRRKIHMPHPEKAQFPVCQIEATTCRERAQWGIPLLTWGITATVH